MLSGKKTEKQQHKKVYERPTLTKYGYAKDLTTAGPCIRRKASARREPRLPKNLT